MIPSLFRSIMWHVYMIECNDGSLYTGITIDIQRRIKEHNASEKGAKYTKTKRPVRLVYLKEIENRSAALKEEHRIKQLPKEGKIKLIEKEIFQ